MPRRWTILAILGGLVLEAAALIVTVVAQPMVDFRLRDSLFLLGIGVTVLAVGLHLTIAMDRWWRRGFGPWLVMILFGRLIAIVPVAGAFAIAAAVAVALGLIRFTNEP